MLVQVKSSRHPGASTADLHGKGLGITGMVALLIGGTLSWMLPIGFRLFSVPVGWWRWRDDAVITLSHAQNLVQFGSIGVSIGDRTEGFSSPLQFALSAIYFAITGGGYGSFLDLHVFTCIGLTGIITTILLYDLISSGKRSKFFCLGVSLAISCAAGILTAASWTAIGWQASGMENPLATVIGMAIAWIALKKEHNGRLIVLSFLLIFLGLVRVEFAPLTLPLIAAVTLASLGKCEGLPKSRLIASIASLPLLIWMMVHSSRWLYFGNLLPNTALVQGKSSGLPGKLFLLIALYFAYGCFAMLALQRKRTARFISFGALWMGIAIVSIVAIAILAVLVLGDPAAGGIYKASIYVIGLLSLIASLGITQFSVCKYRQGRCVADIVFGALLFIPISQFIVMGPARMEEARVLSLATPWASAWLVYSIANALLLVKVPDKALRMSGAAGVIVLASMASFIFSARADMPRDMPWLISPREEKILAVASSFKDQNLDNNSLPIVANPDLGKLSFAKQAMMVDLGWLGDPILARVKETRPDLVVLFLDEVAKPDIVEAHGSWSCKYADWLNSRSFQDYYALSYSQQRPSNKSYQQACPLQGRSGIWQVRNAKSSEFFLSREIANGANPVDLVRRAVRACSARDDSPFRCQAVRRAVYRNIMSLSSSGTYRQVVNAMSASPSFGLDKELLERGTGWDKRALHSFIELADKPEF